MPQIEISQGLGLTSSFCWVLFLYSHFITWRGERGRIINAWLFPCSRNGSDPCGSFLKVGTDKGNDQNSIGGPWDGTEGPGDLSSLLKDDRVWGAGDLATGLVITLVYPPKNFLGYMNPILWVIFILVLVWNMKGLVMEVYLGEIIC